MTFAEELYYKMWETEKSSTALLREQLRGELGRGRTFVVLDAQEFGNLKREFKSPECDGMQFPAICMNPKADPPQREYRWLPDLCHVEELRWLIAKGYLA